MDYTIEFKDFWKNQGRYLWPANAGRTRNNILRRLKACRSIRDIDLYVCSLRSRKETNRRIMVAFFDYLEEKTGEKIRSTLYDKRFFDYPFERQLEIAKYLHEPHTPTEIEERFDIDERTRRKDLTALEDGIEVLGSTIRVEKSREYGKDYYKSTVHPVFLPLNLTEVYALTVYLDRAIDENDPNKAVIQNLINRIKVQLSDYAQDKLFQDEKPPAANNDYLNDEELARQRDGILMYLMKSGRPCRFLWHDREYTGRIQYYGKEYHIILKDGSEFPADIGEVEFVVESLDYK